MSEGLPMFPSPVLIDRDGNETRIQHGDVIEYSVPHHDNAVVVTFRRPDPTKPRVDDRLRVMRREEESEVSYELEMRGHEPICPEFHTVFGQLIGLMLGMLIVYKPSLSRSSPTVFHVWDLAVAPYPD